MRFKKKKNYGHDDREWHYWFAWHPVRIDNNTIVWLEWVARIGEYKHSGRLGAGWDWKYQDTDYRKDPVKYCEVYKTINCAHVDGPMCNMMDCNIRKDYLAEIPKQIKE